MVLGGRALGRRRREGMVEKNGARESHFTLNKYYV